MSALVDLIQQALIDHRIGPAQDPPWYLRKPRASRMPKNFEQTYRCKCREWTGKHSDHQQHVAQVIATLITNRKGP